MTAPRVGRMVDVEKITVAWLTPLLEEADVANQVPAVIVGDVVWVASAGGSAGYDNALLRVDVQCFRPGAPGVAWGLAETVQDAMRGLDGQTVAGQRVNRVSVWAPATRRFWSEAVDRVVTTFELDLPVLL